MHEFDPENEIALRVQQKGGNEIEISTMIQRYYCALQFVQKKNIRISDELAKNYINQVFIQREQELAIPSHIHEDADRKKNLRLITGTGVGVTAIGLAMDVYYLMIMAENMRSIHIEVNFFSFIALYATLLPIGISIGRCYYTPRE